LHTTPAPHVFHCAISHTDIDQCETRLGTTHLPVVQYFPRTADTPIASRRRAVVPAEQPEPYERIYSPPLKHFKMMVPRSYMFQAGQRSTSPSPERKQRAMGLTTTRPRSTPPILKATSTPAPPTLPSRTASEPVSIPSLPMSIQPRSQPSTRSQSQTQTQTLNSRGQHGGRRPRKQDPNHKADALPPAVAALLAVTAIPPPRSLQRRRSSQRTRISIDELVQEWRREGPQASAEKFKSPLDILLEPADETEEDDVSLTELDDEKEPGFISSRSVSSDSIASTPSLDAAYSTMSTISSHSPSLASRRSGSETPRREKLVCSPPTEECDDHPLRPSTPLENLDLEYPTFIPRPERTIKQKSTFKSNLTASLNALKSAAKSFSNFTAPSIPSDDMLSRSLFAARYTSEMRPKGFHGVPDPALRRYLNPTVGVPQLSPSSPDFPTQLQEALASSSWSDNEDERPTPPMIQMQTYSRTRKRRSKSTGPLERGEGAVSSNGLPAIRQREPRENSDFLRVIVLEMSMRRVGKLDSKGPGRARVWLPPRKIVDSSEDGARKNGVPSRWVGMSYTDDD
jgi:hypothetical protein